MTTHDLHALAHAMCGDPKHRVISMCLNIDEQTLFFEVECNEDGRRWHQQFVFTFKEFVSALHEIKYMTPTSAWRSFVLMFYELPHVKLYLTATHNAKELLGLDVPSS